LGFRFFISFANVFSHADFFKNSFAILLWFNQFAKENKEAWINYDLSELFSANFILIET